MNRLTEETIKQATVGKNDDLSRGVKLFLKRFEKLSLVLLQNIKQYWPKHWWEAGLSALS